MQKFFTLLAVALMAVPLFAQESTPKGEVFGGYQYLHVGSNSDLGWTSGQGFNGWEAAATYNVNRNMGVEGDFSGNYASIQGVSTHLYTYAAGPVVFAEMGSIKPFAHVLFGGSRLSGSESGVTISWNGFTTMFGGGVDAKVNKNIAVRVAQVDWLYYHFGSKTIGGVTAPSFSGSNNVRISTGIVFRF